MAQKIDIDEACEEAMSLIDDGDPEGALKRAVLALADYPDHPEALVVKAEALIALDRLDEASEVLEHAATKHPKSPRVLLAAAAFAVEVDFEDNERVEQAFRRLDDAERLATQADESEFAGEIARLRGSAHSSLGELQEAAHAFERAHELLGGDSEVKADLASAWFELLKFDESKALFEEILKRDPKDAFAHHFLGLVAERQGDDKAAEKLFRKARELDPEEFPEPVKLSKEEFDALVERALEGVPVKVRKWLANVPIIVDDLPALEDLRGEPPLSPLSVGLFKGGDINADKGNQLPSSIHLYQRNLERYSTDEDQLVEEIETTLLHEVGHFVGWDEDEVKAHGLE